MEVEKERRNDEKKEERESRKRAHSPRRDGDKRGREMDRREDRRHRRSHREEGRRRRSRDGRDPKDGHFERYWGGKEDEKHDENEKDYLVGSRYYSEAKMKKEIEQEQKNEAVPKASTLMTRTGGAYIPPGKLRLMQASITDKSSTEYQRIAWEALKKSIHGHINKVNTSNIGIVARLLFKENIIRGRGLLARSIIQAQAASPTFTNVYAALVAIINSKFPNIGELVLNRIVIRFKRAYKRNDKLVCLSSSTFIAHLINQRVAHEILGLELLTLMVENPTDDSVEVAVSFLKEAGQKLSEVTSKGSNAIFDMLRNILHEGKLDKREEIGTKKT